MSQATDQMLPSLVSEVVRARREGVLPLSHPMRFAGLAPRAPARSSG